jgi:hypothetical protein
VAIFMHQDLVGDGKGGTVILEYSESARDIAEMPVRDDIKTIQAQN